MPTLNEELNLEHVLLRLPPDVHELLVVDGGSTDSTVETAAKLHPKTRVMRQIGRGKGAALAQAFEVATGDVIVTIDADGSTDPAEIPRFVEALCGGADYVKGSRFLQGGGSEDLTRLRALGNWALTRLVNLLFRTHYSDLCYGFNALWSHHRFIARDVRGFEIETAMNVRVAKAGLRVVEIPSMEWSRRHGFSKLKTFRDGWRVLRTIFRERWTRHRPEAEPDLIDALQARLHDVQPASAQEPVG
jgi:glycosyltransferase involved in cell wall biosynthesis